MVGRLNSCEWICMDHFLDLWVIETMAPDDTSQCMHYQSRFESTFMAEASARPFSLVL